uniref:Anaphase-promoting complex subunit 4 WD40 domain-containing protein n=1 Tax=Hanusia phi TaxID=3032 RepID=A0A7S0E3K7_9CRYP
MNKALGDRTTLDTVSHLNGSVSCFAVLRLDATASTGSCEPSNVVLASGAHDGKLRLWRLNATEEVEVYDQQNDPPPQLLPFGTVTMSADDRSIFSLQCIGRELWVGRGKSRQAECWEYDDGELKAKLKDARKAGPTELSGDGMRKKYDMPDHTGWVRSISSCGDLVFTCGCNFIKVWRHKGEEVEHVGDLESDADILSLCCSPDLLFSGDIRGRIWVWDIRPLLQGGQDVQAVKPCIVQAHDGRITGMKWSPREAEGESGQDMLFSCSHDGFLKCWNPSEEGSLVGGGSSSAMTLKLVAEANALKGMGILARDWERLLSMEISPPGTGKVIQGNMNRLSGHYLYLGTSGGTILVYDRTLKDGELQMVQVSPKMIDLVGGGKISAMLAIPWANRPGKILFLGTDTGKILPWRPVH